MKLFKKILQSEIKKDIPNVYSESYYEVFKQGKKLLQESVSDNSLSEERKKQKQVAALELFDQAIEKGFDDVQVFSLRGCVLRDLNYDLDALDDFNFCISKRPQNASYYYDRALTKQYIYDYEGSLLDFDEAIRLSKLDNEDTKYWNSYAIKTGYNSATQKYQQDLNWLLIQYEQYKENLIKYKFSDLEEKRKANLKRRESNFNKNI